MWTLATPYPTIVARYGFAQTATHFYVFGGVSNVGPTKVVNRMDLATGTWEALAAIPFTQSEAPTCALMESTGLVYCAQGDFGSGLASYNIATDTWTTLASDPIVSDNYGSASGAFNGKVFVAGGGDAFRKSVQIYDVATNTWSVGTAAPRGFLLAGYHQVGQFLYVVGGFDRTVMNNPTTWRLDMSSAPGVWETGPAFTPQRADFGLAYDPNTDKLYALGGDLPNDGNFFNATDAVDELDLGSWPEGTWLSSPPNLPSPRQANQAGFFGASDIWSVGGIGPGGSQVIAEVDHRNNGGGGEIALTARVRWVHGNRLVALSWTPADGGDINVLRDGVVIQTTADDGRAQDRLGAGPREVHVYQVCETDTGTCSNEVKVKVPGSGQ